MKKIVKVMLAMAALLLLPNCAKAQSEVETSLGADVVSSYIWRGQDMGGAALQPTVGISYKGLSLSAWGSYGIVNTLDAKELDLTLKYENSGFWIGATDYFIMAGGGNCPGKYFRYKGGAKGDQVHVLEAGIGYDFGPVALSWYTNVLGADKDYSSYFQIDVPFHLGVDWGFSAGVVPYKSGIYFNDGLTVTNLTLKASKDITITDSFSLPVFSQITANPDTGRFYLLFGLSIGL